MLSSLTRYGEWGIQHQKNIFFSFFFWSLFTRYNPFQRLPEVCNVWGHLFAPILIFLDPTMAWGLMVLTQLDIIGCHQ